MESQKFIINNSEGQHEFDLLVENLEPYVTRFTLLHSNNEMWTAHTRGEIAAQILNTGDGLEIIQPKTIDVLEDEFADLEELDQDEIEIDEDFVEKPTHTTELNYAEAQYIFLIMSAMRHINPEGYDKFTMIPATTVYQL